MNKKIKYLIIDIVSLALAVIIFVVPFYFILLNSLKSRQEAGMMNLALPASLHWENYPEVLATHNYMMVRAFYNSVITTTGSILLLVAVCALGGYVLQRVANKFMMGVNFLILTGLMLPPAILPTIWVMDIIGIYRSLFGLVMVEVALNIPFTVMLYRGYTASIPREIEEAAYVDGCGSVRMFVQIIFPLLLPVTASVVVLSAVNVFNDFLNPLYFLPGAKNPTVQLTLNNFMGRYANSWNMLFADVVLITIPPLILFIFFNRKIVSGITAGAVKG
ncbi:carbohydrate ABC transporter permease [Leadbettera azotonutricia]|uniref:Response regulator receiver protein n=1 Tax=Leadbettera azotonutricia (strain ATCC BAA-888 / DSM 13862 / ZAS-9) TaxID=545695 RepID=F5YF36_LEAAZ|nr:carbohydrate ABC transporter permease [Leadbettera azotonutricia]AEF81265.1 response regulator receiver protein [Leadbettera azotonutricia ZAS-9]